MRSSPYDDRIAKMTNANQPARLALRSALLVDDETVVAGKVVIVCGDRIEAVVSERDFSAGADVDAIDLQNAYLAPGFIDLQLNGCGGVLFNDAITAETLEIMHQTNLRSGTTGFLPTLISTSEEDMRRALAIVANYRDQGGGGVLGIHLEGPYINPQRRGIHSPAAIRKPSPDMVACLIAHARRFPVMLTLAPECNDLRTVNELVES